MMKNIMKTPTLRFSDFTSDWEEKKLGDVIFWLQTNNLSREKLGMSGGEIYNIHYGDIHNKFST